MSNLKWLKQVLREKDCPFFDNEELEFYLLENGQDKHKTAYQCFVIKSEDTTLNIPGLTTGDTSKYFRRLAQRYRPSNSGQLSGGD